MPARIKGDLEAIRYHAANLLHREGFTEAELQREYFKILVAIEVIENQVETLSVHSALFLKTKALVEKDGKPGLILNSIKRILKLTPSG